MKKRAHILLMLFLIVEIIGGIIKLTSNNSMLVGVFIFSGIVSVLIWYILDNDKAKK